MSVYGDFDIRFRPRPALWRIALTGLAQLILTSLIASLLLSAADMLVFWRAGLRKAWLLQAAPWQRLSGIERLSGFGTIIADARATAAPLLAVGMAIFAAILYFWPFRPALGTRMFVMTLVQMLLLWTTWPLVIAANVRIAAVVLLAAAWLIFRAEASITDDLANVIDLQKPWRRLVVWLLRVVPGAAALGALAYENEYVEGWIAAIALAAITLLVALARRPPSRYEKLDGVELREAAAATPIIAALLLGMSLMFFGYPPLGTERRVVVIARGVDIMTWIEARARFVEWWRQRSIPYNRPVSHARPASQRLLRGPRPAGGGARGADRRRAGDDGLSVVAPLRRGGAH